jgi:hypothetical protein
MGERKKRRCLCTVDPVPRRLKVIPGSMDLIHVLNTKSLKLRINLMRSLGSIVT